jgi:hypothetical protein
MGLLLLAEVSIPSAPVAGGSPAGPASCGGGSGTGASGRDLSYALPPGLLGAVTPDGLRKSVEDLQALGTRYIYTERANDAANYIEGRFRALNLTTQRQEFIYNGFTMANVIAFLPGRNASLPEVVLGAHYDSINGSDSTHNSYAPAPGADDDASGVAAVLEAAAAFSRARTERTVVFAAFAGEEIGRVGSIEFVRQAAAQGPGVYAALCLDMIGFNDRFPKVELVSNAASLWLSDLAKNVSRKDDLRLVTEAVVTGDSPENYSDPVSFWEGGYPAMYFIEDENPSVSSTYYQANRYFHTAQDTADRLNFTLMTKVARLGAATTAALAGLSLADFIPVVRDPPVAVLEGDNATYRLAIANLGSPEPSVNISLAIDGVTVLNVPASPGVPLELAWVASRGTHLASITADSDDQYLEWDETNNRVDFVLEVRARPELQVLDFRVSDYSPVPGQGIFFLAELVNNGGANTAGRFIIFSADEPGGPLTDEPLVLLPGQTTYMFANTTAPDVETSFTAEILDVAPPETNHGNNLLNLTIRPDVLDTSAYRVILQPDVAATFDDVRVSVDGIDPSFDSFFDFGDGQEAGWTGSGYTHQYSRPGTYFVRGRVRDAKGAYAELDPAPVVIRNRPPSAVIDASLTIAALNQTVYLSAARSSDPDGEIIQYFWDFGDGGKQFGANARRTFAALRTYTVSLSVTDDGGMSTMAVLDISVVNFAPVARASASASLLFAGEAVFFNASGSTDAEGQILLYMWDFGNGHEGRGSTVQYSFPERGNYTITLRVRDDLGAEGMTTIQVTVLETLRPLNAPVDAGNAWLVPAVLLALLVAALAIFIIGGRHPPGDGRPRQWRDGRLSDEEG